MIETIGMPEAFTKNGFEFRLIDRSTKVALYGTYLDGELCGFEVVRIYVKDAHCGLSGRQCPARESITSNRQFGFDGSHCYFRTEPRRARQYFKALSDEITAIENGSKYHFYTNKYSRQ